MISRKWLGMACEYHCEIYLCAEKFFLKRIRFFLLYWGEIELVTHPHCRFSQYLQGYNKASKKLEITTTPNQDPLLRKLIFITFHFI